MIQAIKRGRTGQATVLRLDGVLCGKIGHHNRVVFYLRLSGQVFEILPICIVSVVTSG